MFSKDILKVKKDCKGNFLETNKDLEKKVMKLKANVFDTKVSITLLHFSHA